MQVSLGAPPVSIQSALAHRLHQRDFADAQTGEKTLLDEFRQARLILSELGQRDVEPQKIIGTELGIGDVRCRIERDHLQPRTAAFVGQTSAHVVDHYLAHGLGSQREKMRASLQIAAARLRHFQIGLVNQTRRVQGMARRCLQLRMGHAFEFGINMDEQGLHGLGLSAAYCLDQCRDVAHRRAFPNPMDVEYRRAPENFAVRVGWVGGFPYSPVKGHSGSIRVNRRRAISTVLQGSLVMGSLCFTPLALAAKSIVVNSTTDLPDDDVGDNLCHTTANTCTLRAAVMQASNSDAAITDGVVITLPAGLYTLNLPIASGGGQLELSNPPFGTTYIKIIGAGAATTIIDGNAADRVVHISPLRPSLISGVTIRNGRPPGKTDSGGGILNEGYLALNSSIVSDNSAAYYGGGIANKGNLVMLASSIESNHAGLTGGGIWHESDTYYDNFINMFASTIASNTAQYAGGIFNGASMSITDSTIAENLAGDFGGGIFEGGGYSTFHANIYNSTIVGNVADANRDGVGSGGGIFAATTSTKLNIYNTIIAGNNFANSPIPDDCSGPIYTHARNLLGNKDGCTIVQVSGSWDLVNSLSLLGALQDNGGPTKTVALLPGSNAIDAGDPITGCRDSNSEQLATDQRLLPRNIGICDIGAYEYGAFDPTDVIFRNGFEPVPVVPVAVPSQ